MTKKTTRQPKETKQTKPARKPSSGQDNRAAGERIPIQLLVDYRCDGNYLFDFCKDLGQGGIFIETKQPKTQGSVLDLTFTIPDSKETLSARGRVIWVQDPLPERPNLTPGMGIQFEAFSHKDRQTLENFVKRYRKDMSKSA